MSRCTRNFASAKKRETRGRSGSKQRQKKRVEGACCQETPYGRLANHRSRAERQKKKGRERGRVLAQGFVDREKKGTGSSLCEGGSRKTSSGTRSQGKRAKPERKKSSREKGSGVRERRGGRRMTGRATRPAPSRKGRERVFPEKKSRRESFRVREASGSTGTRKR